ncbi:MAG: DNA polymerase III subunit alpha [Phycisphaerales bacterium]|nr:DNA polymerase III subunit alpha [Phycisphaerales bacterium]
MTASPRFTHLHLHSEYSLLDGHSRISPLIDRIAELGMSAVALTDHGNLFGAAEFYTTAKRAGIKPILGIEAYVAPEARTDHRPSSVGPDGGFHLVLLARNTKGWQNLLRLSSDAYLKGFYRKPRMDKEILGSLSEGLIAINGHLGSSLAYHLLRYDHSGDESHWQAAVQEATWHAETFGPDEHGEPCFFVELQRLGVEDQTAINPHLIRLAQTLELPLVCDNDAHFIKAEDHDSHDTLCCISMGRTKSDASRLTYPQDIYVKSPEQMASAFHDVPEAIENTNRIADRCDADIDFSESHAPVVRVTAPQDDATWDGKEDLTDWFKRWCTHIELHPYDAETDTDVDRDGLEAECDRALRSLAEAGMTWRYGADGIDEPIRARCERELQILSEKRISAYFLICWDVVNWARQRGIPASARGSGVGTMVGYVLGLSNACPVKYGLLFERFTDPDRSEYPDIDIDICQNGRGKVIQYVREKYGHVAQIITFGRLKARAAIKDVSRVMGLEPVEGQRLSNLVPSELNITIDAALESSPEFKLEYERNTMARRVIDEAKNLEGHARHAGVHAAGVVVATQPLDTIVPLCRVSGNDEGVTQWDGPTCERVGLLKMDFLGLRTLSTLELARELVRVTLDEKEIWAATGREPGDGPHPLDLDRIPWDDQRVLSLFRRGDTSGIFQFESTGMRQLLREMKPDRLEDLIAANALYRPGPMDLIPEYNARKHGQKEVPSIHPIVDAYTAETYGIMVYQEQVMQIVHGLGDIPLRQAYTLIKAISKKKVDVIDSARGGFIDGSAEKGLSRKEAENLFDLILKFAGYGFNKSHSTGYAIIAYQTAWLKTWFPVQYMASVLTFESAAKKTEDWAPYLEDCRHVRFPDHADDAPHEGIEVKGPDINQSRRRFTVVHDEDEVATATTGSIRFGLGGIKGVGQAAVESLITERDAHGPYTSLWDLCERAAPGSVNRATLEALIKAGALDSLHGIQARSAMADGAESALRAGHSLARDAASGQGQLFGGSGAEPEEVESSETNLPDITPWSDRESLKHERELLGFHVSGHPLDEFDDLIGTFCTGTLSQLGTIPLGRQVRVGAMIASSRIVTIQKGRNAGQRMAMMSLQDRTSSIDAVMFSDHFARDGHLATTDAVVIIEGHLDINNRSGDRQFIIQRVLAPPDAARCLTDRIELRVPMRPDESDRAAGERLRMTAGVIKQAGGARTSDGGHPANVVLHLDMPDQLVTLKSEFRVVPHEQLVHQLTEMLGGREQIKLVGTIPKAAERSGNNRGRRSQ